MSGFVAGQTVRCVKTWTTHVIDGGEEYVLQDVDTVAGYVQVMGTWVPDDHFEPIAQASKHAWADLDILVDGVKWEGMQ